MDASVPVAPACQGLVRVSAYASCVCPFPLVDSWQVIRDWGSFAWLPQLFGSRLDSSLQSDGSRDDCIVRRTTFGNACVYERLLVLDDLQHLLRWQIITGKSDSQNPFPASLVNYVTAIQLLPVSVGDQTYLAWSGDFMTEAYMAVQMKAVFEAMYRAGFQGLKQHLESKAWEAASIQRFNFLPPGLFPTPAEPHHGRCKDRPDLEDSASTGSCCSRAGS